MFSGVLDRQCKPPGAIKREAPSARSEYWKSTPNARRNGGGVARARCPGRCGCLLARSDKRQRGEYIIGMSARCLCDIFLGVGWWHFADARASEAESWDGMKEIVGYFFLVSFEERGFVDLTDWLLLVSNFLRTCITA